MGFLYKIRHLTPSVKSLYFSIFNSHVSYGIVAWGNASQVDINKIISLQNKAVTEITCLPKGVKPNISHDYYNLNILNIHDQFKVQLSSLMWDYDHNTLPSSLTAKVFEEVISYIIIIQDMRLKESYIIIK